MSRLPSIVPRKNLTVSAQWVKNPPAMQEIQEMQVPPLGQKYPSPGDGNGNPFQYSCMGNPMDRRAWWATIHGVAESQI